MPQLVLASGSNWVIRFPDGNEHTYKIERKVIDNANLASFDAINQTTKQPVIILARKDQYGITGEIESVTRHYPVSA